MRWYLALLPESLADSGSSFSEKTWRLQVHRLQEFRICTAAMAPHRVRGRFFLRATRIKGGAGLARRIIAPMNRVYAT
jgi:hypothetical protein